MNTKKISYEEAKNIQLSANFTLDEFIKSYTATRYDIDNSIPEEFLPNIQYLVTTILQHLRNHFGPLRITSGYRSPELSIKIGSSRYSNHCYGLAADIEPYDKSIPLVEILTYMDAQFKYKELIAEFFPHGWVHVAATPADESNILKLKDDRHHYARVPIDYIRKIYAPVKIERPGL